MLFAVFGSSVRNKDGKRAHFGAWGRRRRQFLPGAAEAARARAAIAAAVRARTGAVSAANAFQVHALKSP
jgi:hypothetical protein